MADIATKKIFENDKIAVWEMVLEPGESTGLHTHSRDYLFYVVEDAPGELTDEQGNLLRKLEMKDGETMFFRLEGQELVAGNLRVPAAHNARNVGTNRYREILVETK